MKYTEQNASGTYFVTIFKTTFAKLVEKIGKPSFYYGDKTFYEWCLETEEGDVFTIYDWKKSFAPCDNEMYDWHIGAKSEEVGKKAVAELKALGL